MQVEHPINNTKVTNVSYLSIHYDLYQQTVLLLVMRGIHGQETGGEF
jgi:hypothetical protein